MTKKYISLDFRLKKIDETKNNLSEEIKHSDLMNEKQKNKNKSVQNFQLF